LAGESGAKRRNLFGSDVLRSFPSRKSLDGLSEVKHLVDFLLRYGGDTRSLAWWTHQKTAPDKRPDRFPEWSAADAKPTRQRGLADYGSAGELAV
jgi:hypothetical protein